MYIYTKLDIHVYKYLYISMYGTYPSRDELKHSFLKLEIFIQRQSVLQMYDTDIDIYQIILINYGA